VFGLILGWAGFDASVAVQAPETIFWIRAMLATVPVAGLIVAILFILRLSLTKKMCEEMRVALEKRRGTV
jgi:GPH family glycoside/pentoside/hexuronide:cation symporter